MIEPKLAGEQGLVGTAHVLRRELPAVPPEEISEAHIGPLACVDRQAG